MRYDHKNKETLGRFHRIDITNYVATFLSELAEREKKSSIRLKTHGDADRIKGLLNIPKNSIFKSLRNFHTDLPYWIEQRVDYVPSNLSRGYIYYFLCNGCGRRVKYLHEYHSTLSPLCRLCCHLTYRRNKR